ncbi:MAG: elongation factor Ts [Candidatus Doudnabacteria bacterium RIFCSPHIGHO2_01_FULL_50_11]|uniref:Elongation factor Ts n=1 Tax=Candidatus Doudnabacteria bacterium RIFCSPHIGHO2_01_FULL_50_11 TaxID=1817828 RepID=A0A1F5PGG5_9BACT|nr:MAG: elongation factor Ts [Candidatus Doudnabacteria bacterium RIFCSPHIGHO2_01_FULL_50_11]HLC44418.1 translation elongation factor Ts [Patescibacteria group bacterium]
MSSIKISLQALRKLREMTGVGMQDAQNALQESGGDIAEAHKLLRKRGVARAAKKSSRAAKDGIIDCYVHGTKVGVMIEVNCETDFVAKTPDFKSLVHELALQIAGASPRYVSREQVPASIIESERAIYRAQSASEKKPANVQEKIVEGKLEKFYQETCLLEQPSIKDPKVKVGTIITDAVAKLGENIVVSRFVRYQLGEEFGN